MLNHIPRNLEVLIKKAAVDPAFKKTLLEKRAAAAGDIALTLSQAETAILEAAPADQLKAIIGRTKVSPGLRPAFLGYAAAAMLAALAARAAPAEAGDVRIKSYGAQPGVPPETYSYTINDPESLEVPEGAGVIFGRIRDQDGDAVTFTLVEIEELGMSTLSNRYGFYVLSPVPPGTYTLSFQLDPPRKELPDIEVREGMLTDASINVVVNKPEPRPGGNGMGTGIRPDRPDEEGD